MQKTAEKEQKLEELIIDRQKFDQYVYFSIEDALKEIEKRQKNKKLENYLKKVIDNDVPKIMQGKKSIVLFRHVATLNHEMRRFILLTEVLEDFQPLILEYTEDKFTNWNEWKYYLGRILLVKGYNKNRRNIFESHNIIDFNSSNGRPISSIKTHWGQSLVQFHHEIFTRDFPHLMKGNVFDLSPWLHKHGKSAKDYYKSFLSLFLKDAILLENFLFEIKERAFTTEVILPALLSIEEETGLKPLIVALEPTELEDQRFWHSHPHSEKEFILEKMKKDL